MAVPLSEDRVVVLADSSVDLRRREPNGGGDVFQIVSMTVSSRNSGISVISDYTRSEKPSKIQEWYPTGTSAVTLYIFALAKVTSSPLRATSVPSLNIAMFGFCIPLERLGCECLT